MRKTKMTEKKNIDCSQCARFVYCKKYENITSLEDAFYRYYPKYDADCPGFLEDREMSYEEVMKELNELEHVLLPANDNPETVDGCNRKKCAVARAIEIIQKVDRIKGYFNE